MKIALCDDNNDVLNFLENQLSVSFGSRFEVVRYNNARNLWQDWTIPLKRTDIIIMDILFPDENGVNIAKKIQELYSDVKIIFITGYPELAPQIFRAIPTFLLIKPISPEFLIEAVATAENQIQLENNKAIPISYNGSIKNIKSNSIYYLEITDRHVILHCTDGDFITTQKMSDLEATLPSDNFNRIHKSFLVNMDYIIEYNYTQLTLSNAETLTISRTRAKNAKKKFLGYLKSH